MLLRRTGELCVGRRGTSESGTSETQRRGKRNRGVRRRLVGERNVVVRDCDAQKAVLARVVSKSLGARMEISKIQDKGTQKAVFLDCAPIYEVAYGIAQKKFGEESECGDTLSVLCPSRTRRLFALCDGMGHGDKASETSKNAVKMIESFYRAGIESSIVLSLVNKLLKLGAEDMFSTLDISVLDMQTGGLDVVKLGSASSFIIRKDNIEMLTCTGAPIVSWTTLSA